MCLFDQNLGTQERGVQVAQAIPKQPPLPSTHLWLKGLPPKHACVDDVRVAFCQWLGDNGKLAGSVEDKHHLLFDCRIQPHTAGVQPPFPYSFFFSSSFSACGPSQCGRQLSQDTFAQRPAALSKTQVAR